ncbi:hypothetical protein JIN77_03925 [Verrucomicrobiaceae bacterium R5-34]|nr:hypothetical protein [Verrucomicrobiaceae bacterium R5-34]
MILDAIIGLFIALASALAASVAVIFVPLINLAALGVEAVIGLFVSGFSLGRIRRDKDEAKSTGSVILSIVTLLLILGVITYFFVAPVVINRQVTLVAEDGHSLPYAALMIHTDSGTQHQRTDKAGNIVIPRFATNAITVKDPRYVERTWAKSEIEPELVVGRTVLGASLDTLADKLLKPAKE